MRFRLSFLGAVLVSGAPRASFAAPRAELAVTREDGAMDCPAEAAIQDAVAARLGYDPFVTSAPMRIGVAFRRNGRTLTSTVELWEGGVSKGARTLRSARGDCEELASTTTLTISILLDPRSMSNPPPPDPVRVPEEPPPKVTVPAPPPKVGDGTLRAPSTQVLIAAALAGSLGASPSPTLGGLFGVSVARSWWSLGLEFRLDAATSSTENGTHLSGGFLGGTLLPCGRSKTVYACAFASLGSVRGEVAGAIPSSHATLHVLLGPRLGLSLPISRELAFDAHADLGIAPTRSTLRLGDRDLWSTGLLSPMLAIGALGRFP